MNLLTNQETLRLFSDKFEQTVLRSAYTYLNNLHDPLRCNSFALVIRELIRITMSRIAPDTDVKDTSWWVGDNGVVMRSERFRFAISGYLSDDLINLHPEFDTSSEVKQLVKAVGTLSKFTHISAGTYNKSDAEVSQFTEEIEDAVIEYSNILWSTQQKIQDCVWELTHDELNSSIMDLVPDELLNISSNTIVESAVVEQLQSLDLHSSSPEITGSGSVEVELNYGSRKDGISTSDSYPLEFRATVDPDSLSISIESIDVDTDSFYE